MMNMKYNVDGYEFKSKNKLTGLVRDIIGGYKAGCELKGADLKFILELLKYHVRYEEKVGCGIDKILLRKNTYGKLGFMIIRKDGSEVDFSWVKIIKYMNEKSDQENKRDYILASLIKACREAVKYDIRCFKLNYFKKYGEDGVALCQETGEMIDYTQADVHHSVVSFKEIVEEWLNVFSVNIFNVKIGGYEDMSDTHYFIDKDVENCFRKFHNQKAKLIIVNKQVHTSKLV